MENEDYNAVIFAVLIMQNIPSRFHKEHWNFPCSNLSNFLFVCEMFSKYDLKQW